jgi:hypothetical protein
MVIGSSMLRMLQLVRPADLYREIPARAQQRGSRATVAQVADRFRWSLNCLADGWAAEPTVSSRGFVEIVRVGEAILRPGQQPETLPYCANQHRWLAELLQVDVPCMPRRCLARLSHEY